MQIIKIEESREPCAESGWYAYDFWLAETVEAQHIQQLADRGDLIWLKSLKTPFYKLNQPYLFLQGLQGEAQFRLAVYQEQEKAALEEVGSWVESW